MAANWQRSADNPRYIKGNATLPCNEVLRNRLTACGTKPKKRRRIHSRCSSDSDRSGTPRKR